MSLSTCSHRTYPGLNLSHFCRDHAGGNEEMAKRIPGIKIIGGEHDHVAAATQQVADKQQISVGSINIQCIETPFHTQGHICYLCSEEGFPEKIVFTGDTLFIGGCGRYQCNASVNCLLRRESV